MLKLKRYLKPYLILLVAGIVLLVRPGDLRADASEHDE